MTNKLGSLEKELQLRNGHPDSAPLWKSPRRGEPAFLESLGVDTKPCSVPSQHFRASSISADEKKQIATERVAFKSEAHQGREPIERFPHVARLSVRPGGHLAGAADHVRAPLPEIPEHLYQTIQVQADHAMSLPRHKDRSTASALQARHGAR